MTEPNLPDRTALDAFLTGAHRCAGQMMMNAAFIQQEQPKVILPAGLDEDLGEVCRELIGTKHDVVSEVHEVWDLLEDGWPPDAPSTVARIANRVGRIQESNRPVCRSACQHYARRGLNFRTYTVL